MRALAEATTQASEAAAKVAVTAATAGPTQLESRIAAEAAQLGALRAAAVAAQPAVSLTQAREIQQAQQGTGWDWFRSIGSPAFHVAPMVSTALSGVPQLCLAWLPAFS